MAQVHGRGRRPALTLLTLNVNGFGPAAGRARTLLSYITTAACNPDVVFLQEVKLADEGALRAALLAGLGDGLPWKGQVFYAPGSDHSCGTAVLVRDGSLLSSCDWARADGADDGRVVRVDCSLLHHPISLVSVYAPNAPAQRRAFFSSLQHRLPPDRLVFLGGDLNCVLGGADELRHSASRHQGAAELRTLMEEHSLVDVWSSRQPQQPGFTFHRGVEAPTAARLDRWLMPAAAAPWVTALSTVAGSPSDHYGVLLCVEPPDLPALGGQGWCFPSYVLHHPSPLR